MADEQPKPIGYRLRMVRLKWYIRIYSERSLQSIIDESPGMTYQEALFEASQMRQLGLPDLDRG